MSIQGMHGFSPQASILNTQSQNVASLSEESRESPAERAREALKQTSPLAMASNLAPGQGSRVDLLA